VRRGGRKEEEGERKEGRRKEGRKKEEGRRKEEEGPSHGAGSQNRFVCTLQGPVSLTVGDQNAIKSCRWNSDFYLSAVVNAILWREFAKAAFWRAKAVQVLYR